MRFRKLRIAWSVLCGLACVLLVVLWVRSYWSSDVVGQVFGGRRVAIGSDSGVCYFFRLDLNRIGTRDSRWQYTVIEPTIHPSTFRWASSGGFVELRAPHSLLAALTAAIAFMPWVRYRFSLRTLLIATTLIALALGIVVYAASR